MSGTWAGILLCGAVGFAVAAGSATPAIRRAPPTLVRVNFRGARVPAVLGLCVRLGGLAGVAVSAILLAASVVQGADAGATASAGLVVAILGAAGAWDDRRGDERPRGFRGHLEAAGSGVLTGGAVKALAGAAAGLAAGALTSSGWEIVTTGAVIALTANLINLLDRAPGRAAKAGLLMGIPLLAAGPPGWAIAGAGTLGAAAGVLPADLAERGMLGDSGANVLGGVIGLGLAASIPFSWQIAAAGALLALNGASERWSFSEAIERTPPLRVLDRLGQTRRSKEP
jgi:hypothetical protein